MNSFVDSAISPLVQFSHNHALKTKQKKMEAFFFFSAQSDGAKSSAVQQSSTHRYEIESANHMQSCSRITVECQSNANFCVSTQTSQALLHKQNAILRVETKTLLMAIKQYQEKTHFSYRNPTFPVHTDMRGPTLDSLPNKI